MKLNIKRFPDATEGGGSVTPNVAIPKAAPKTFTPSMPKPVPESVKTQTFSVEQLPSLGEDEGHQIAPEVVNKPSKLSDIPVQQLDSKSTDEGVDNTLKPSLEGSVKPVTKPLLDKKVDDTPEPVVNKFLKPPKTGDKKEEVAKAGTGNVAKPIVPPDKSKTFDYTPYTPQEQEVLKNMSVQAREYTSKVIKENNELAKLKQSNYLQHPEAYVLDPQYKEISANVSYAYKEAQHYAQQLELCKQGKPVKLITGWDGDKPVYSAEVTPTDAVEEDLRLYRQNCLAVGNTNRQQLQSFPQRYQQQIQNDMGTINQTRNSLFGWLQDPKLLDYTIDVGGIEKSIKEIKNEVMSLWPPYMRNHPAVETVGDLMVALRIRDAELADVKNTSQVSTTKLQEAKSVEFGSKDKPISQGKIIGGVGKFDLDSAGVEI